MTRCYSKGLMGALVAVAFVVFVLLLCSPLGYAHADATSAATGESPARDAAAVAPGKTGADSQSSAAQGSANSNSNATEEAASSGRSETQSGGVAGGETAGTAVRDGAASGVSDGASNGGSGGASGDAPNGGSALPAESNGAAGLCGSGAAGSTGEASQSSLQLTQANSSVAAQQQGANAGQPTSSAAVGANGESDANIGQVGGALGACVGQTGNGSSVNDGENSLASGKTAGDFDVNTKVNDETSGVQSGGSPSASGTQPGGLPPADDTQSGGLLPPAIDPSDADDPALANDKDDADAVVAYALFDAYKGTLLFSRAPISEVPASKYFEGKWVFTGFESAAYTSANIPWGFFRGHINEVVFADGVSPVNTNNWFAHFDSLTSFDAQGYLDMSQVESADNMFYSCKKLTRLNMSGWDVGNLRSVKGMLDGCTALESVEGFDAVLATLSSNPGSVTGLDGLRTFGVSQLGMADEGAGSADDVDPEKNDGTLGESAGEGLLGELNGNGDQLDGIEPEESDEGGLLEEDPPEEIKMVNEDAAAVSEEMEPSTAHHALVQVKRVPKQPRTESGLSELFADAPVNEQSAREGDVRSDRPVGIRAEDVIDGAIAGIAQLAKAAQNACATSIAESVSIEGLITPLSGSGTAFGSIVAGAAIALAASVMLGFALKLH